MEPTALVMMIILLGLIWGGFAFTLRLAIRKERVKKNTDW